MVPHNHTHKYGMVRVLCCMMATLRHVCEGAGGPHSLHILLGASKIAGVGLHITCETLIRVDRVVRRDKEINMSLRAYKNELSGENKIKMSLRYVNFLMKMSLQERNK